MDPDIVNDPAYKDTLEEALLSLPTMSIVTDQANLFDQATGIYTNPLSEGWERPISLEYFDPATSDQFQINAGLSIYGGVGRYPEFKKHSLRVVFKDVYGAGKLNFPLFGDQATGQFDTFILRSNFNDGWTWGGTQSQFIRDQFADRTLLAMMSTAEHGSFVHLYVNGMYWGVYNPVERPDTSFAATYLGGDKDNWDGVNAGAPVGGSNMQPWYDLMNFNFEGGSTAAYQRVQGNFPDGTNDPATESLLDVSNYIDYLLMNFFVANADWPGHNWYVARPRGADSTGFKFFPWDTEMAVGLSWIRDPAGDVTGVGGPDSNDPAEPYYWLQMNPDFKMLFADHAQKALFNGGALTTAAAVARYQDLADEVAAAVSAESARWGTWSPGALQTDRLAERTRLDPQHVPAPAQRVPDPAVAQPRTLPEHRGPDVPDQRHVPVRRDVPTRRFPQHDRAGGDDLLQPRRHRSAPARWRDPTGRFGLQRSDRAVDQHAREVPGVREWRVERHERGHVLRRSGPVDPHHRDHVQPGGADRRGDRRRLHRQRRFRVHRDQEHRQPDAPAGRAAIQQWGRLHFPRRRFHCTRRLQGDRPQPGGVPLPLQHG